MKPEQLISAGFAITALAAASVPAVGWTLLGAVELPPVLAESSYTVAFPQPAATAVPVSIERNFPDSLVYDET